MGHTYRGPKSGCTMVTLFGGYSYDGVIADIWVIYTEVPNLGARWSLYRLGGSIRFGYCAIPCFGGLCEERLPCL